MLNQYSMQSEFIHKAQAHIQTLSASARLLQGKWFGYISTYEYKSSFDRQASTSISASIAEGKTFSAARRIHGTVKSAENIMPGLEMDTDELIIEFSAVD